MVLEMKMLRRVGIGAKAVGLSVLSWCRRYSCPCYRVLKRTAVGAWVGLVLILSLYGFYTLYDWWQDTSPVVAYGAGEITPLEPHPGDKMLAYLDVQKLRDCDGEVRRVVTGDCGHHVLSEVRSSLVQGFNGRLAYPFQLPIEAIPGQCMFKLYARYWCNPFDLIMNRQVYQSPGIPFRVKGWKE